MEVEQDAIDVLDFDKGVNDVLEVEQDTIADLDVCQGHTVTKSRKKSTQENKMLLLKNPQFLSNSELWSTVVAKKRKTTLLVKLL